MEQDSVTLLRTDIAALRGDFAKIRQDLSVLDARTDALENWRERYLAQEDQVFDKVFAKVDQLVAALSEMRADLSRIRGERDAERRMTITVISLLSAICGGLATNFLHFPGH
jgi:ribosomal 50S subunit-associated protein YjgA (DUF615 family)